MCSKYAFWLTCSHFILFRILLRREMKLWFVFVFCGLGAVPRSFVLSSRLFSAFYFHLVAQIGFKLAIFLLQPPQVLRLQVCASIQLLYFNFGFLFSYWFSNLWPNQDHGRTYGIAKRTWVFIKQSSNVALSMICSRLSLFTVWS